MSEQYIIPIFVPHLGCPNDCTFCNQKSISGQTKQVTSKDVKEIIEKYLKSFKDERLYKEVAFFRKFYRNRKRKTGRIIRGCI